MSRGILHWWPLAPALLILYLGGSSFIEEYPRATQRASAPGSVQTAPDSLLAFIHAGLKSDSLSRTGSGSSPTEPSADSSARLLASLRKFPNRENPSRPIHGPNFSAEHAKAGPKIEPPLRKFVLKGTVGNEVATISDHTGRKLIVKVGDGVDSAVVLSIEANKVILKDRAGKFELLQEK